VSRRISKLLQTSKSDLTVRSVLTDNMKKGTIFKIAAKRVTYLKVLLYLMYNP